MLFVHICQVLLIHRQSKERIRVIRLSLLFVSLFLKSLFVLWHLRLQQTLMLVVFASSVFIPENFLLALMYMNTRSGKKERISRLFQMHSNKQNPKDVIGCGDIGAGVGFKDIRTGDTLCDENQSDLIGINGIP
jgi:hypothetical protein